MTMNVSASVWGDVTLRDGRTVRVRRVKNNDAALFLDFFTGLSAQSRDYMHGWEQQCAPDRAEEWAGKLAAKADSPQHCGIVAVTPDAPERIVGYCWVDGLNSDDIPMLGIGIIDTYHEVGLGKVFFNLMFEYLRQNGVPQVKLGVWEDNPRALHVYERAGFHTDPSLPTKDFDGRIELYLLADTKAE